ncbi:MAG TPA: hypothetical protein VJ484_01245, partial [Lysobacter sp.]|nr:hypothetical protein [Lysobacter sp.]
VVEVDGRLRLSVDARQNNLTLAAMDADQSGFEQADFVQRYSNFVKDYVAFAVKGKPANYPVAPTALPAPDTALASTHSTILEPASIDYEDGPVDRKALGFGLYIDYLSADTLEVYEQVLDCKTRGDTTSDECKVLGLRDPLEFVPFFALNLASLGEWNTDDESIVDIYGATYTPQGTLENQGGLVKWGAGSSQEKIPGSEKINVSNSGLTATVPVDLDDGADQSFVTDWLSFLKAVGNSTQPPKSLVVRVAASSTITLQKIGVSSPAGVTPCDYTPKDAASSCSVPAGASTTTLRLSNFTTSEKVQGSTVIHDRKVCLTNDKRIVSAQTYFPGTVNEYIDLQIDGMNTTDHVLTIEIMDASDPCSPGQVSLTPAN